MLTGIDILKKSITELLRNQEFHDWEKIELTIQFPPYSSKSIRAAAICWDDSNNPIDFGRLKWDADFLENLYQFIYINNQNNDYNQIIYSTMMEDFENAKIIISFNQAVEDEFQSFLPKSKRGKTIPWWKNENEISKLRR